MKDCFKKIFLTAALVSAGAVQTEAQSIAYRGEYQQDKLVITSPIRLFSGCDICMAAMQPKNGGKKHYGIELDLTDRVYRVRKGNLLTVYMKDGTQIEMSNFADTKADITEETHLETQDNYNTTFVSGYDPWFDAFYTEPVTFHTRTTEPVTTVTSYAELYYLISLEQINAIINGKVDHITIATDDGIIEKKARPLSAAIQKLFPLVR